MMTVAINPLICITEARVNLIIKVQAICIMHESKMFNFFSRNTSPCQKDLYCHTEH